MSWAEYLAVRRAKRRWEMMATLPSTLLAFGLSANYFGSLESDPTKPIFGVDALYVFGAATVACAGLGYLLGPTIGGAGWRLTHRQVLPLIESRERDFHKHIVRNRVDPRAQSATNPVPDFYGEKIGSLHQYRQWLRDQSKYRKKAAWATDPK
ncbi:mitochondrial import protein Pam17 [Ramaria rubella]|nr:mitochondrial import protein Pam17 [Ramaria rubella]